jgi:hypothetical protein
MRFFSRVMDMRRILLSTLLSLFLLLQIGCQTIIVSGKRLEGMAGVHLIRPGDAANSTYWAKNIFSVNPVNSSKIDGNIEQKSPIRIKYHPSYFVNRWMAVEGSLAGGRKYPVILDTGASVALFVNDIHIMENKLTIYPLNRSSDDSIGWGMCQVPELHIGQLTLTNWPCHYREQHTEFQLLGIPFDKSKAVIAGLAALRRFKYVAFDSIEKEVELSANETFKPKQPELWTQYPFSIEEDLGGNVFLLIKIPIAGKEVELQLDTGSGRGLAINQELWEQIRKEIRHVRLRKGRDLYPYIGLLSCIHGVIPELEVGNRTVKNAKISVFPNDSPIMEQCSGMLGMQYFENTVMVLDFEQDLMWLKNPTGR